MALHNFTITDVRSRERRRPMALWVILLGVATSALPSLARAQVAVPFSTNVQFANTSQVATYVVDLGTLPARPELVIDAIPTGANSNLEIQIEISEVQISSFAGPESCPEFSGSPIRSAPRTGPAQLVWKVWVCDPPISGDSGETARVSVRVASFGSGGAPANVQIAMRGVTSPPVGTQLMPYWTPGVQHTITLKPIQDTTIYERNPSGSNGAGTIPVGRARREHGEPLHAVRRPLTRDLSDSRRADPDQRDDQQRHAAPRRRVDPRHGQLSPGLERRIQSTLGRKASRTPRATSSRGPRARCSAANWTLFSTGPDYRLGRRVLDRWRSHSLLLASQAVTTAGIKSIHVDSADGAMLRRLLTNTGTLNYQDGFILRGAESSSTSSGIQMASRENAAVGATPPELVVTFTLPAAPQEGLAEDRLRLLHRRGPEPALDLRPRSGRRLRDPGQRRLHRHAIRVRR